MRSGKELPTLHYSTEWCFNLQQHLVYTIKQISDISDQLRYQGVCISYSYHNNATTEGIPHSPHMESTKCA